MRLGQPNLTCKSDPADAGLPTPSGLGFFAHSYTSADALTLPDPRPTLRTRRKETLIIRGTCGYIPWDVSAEYLQVIPGAHYVAIPAAGRHVWLEQPMMFAEVVLAFLKGEKRPLEAYAPPGRIVR
jgi:proline iminopeptidase